MLYFSKESYFAQFRLIVNNFDYISASIKRKNGYSWCTCSGFATIMCMSTRNLNITENKQTNNLQYTVTFVSENNFVLLQNYYDALIMISRSDWLRDLLHFVTCVAVKLFFPGYFYLRKLPKTECVPFSIWVPYQFDAGAPVHEHSTTARVLLCKTSHFLQDPILHFLFALV